VPCVAVNQSQLMTLSHVYTFTVYRLLKDLLSSENARQSEVNNCCMGSWLQFDVFKELWLAKTGA